MEVSNTSSYLDLDPSSQMEKSYLQQETAEDRAILRYNELYVRDHEKLSIFENYIKNRVTESAYLWGKTEERKNRPMIARRKNFHTYVAPVDLTNSMIGEHNHTKTPINERDSNPFFQTNEDALTPRGIINSFLLNDPASKINKFRSVSAEPNNLKEKINAKKFFIGKKADPVQKPESIEEIKPEKPKEEKPDRPRSALKKSKNFDETRDTSKLKVREVENDTSTSKANNETTAFLRPNSRIESAKSKKSAVNFVQETESSHTGASSSNLNISNYVGKAEKDKAALEASFGPEIEEDRKFRELEKKVHNYIEAPYKPVYRDDMEEEIVALQAEAQQEILLGLKAKLKTFEKKPKPKFNKNPLNLKTVMQDSISDAMSDIDSKRASIGGLSDLFVEKPAKDMEEKLKNIPIWLQNQEGFTREYKRGIKDTQKLVLVICDKPSHDRHTDELRIVAEWLHRVKIFKDLPLATRQSIASFLTYKGYQKDEILCSQGEVGECLYIIFDGLVRCYVNGNEVAFYKAHDAPGQLALEGPTKRTATLKAAYDTDVLLLDKEHYRDIMENYTNLERNNYYNLMKSVKIFKDMAEKKLKMIAGLLQSKYFSKGEIIYDENDAAECLYILKSGLIQIECTQDVERENIWPLRNRLWRRNKTTRTMKFTHKIYPKEYFGEVELLKSLKRLNRVVCINSCHVLILNKNDFLNILDFEDLSKMKVALSDSILEDPDVMKRKLIMAEQEKRYLKDKVLEALGDYMRNAGPVDLPRIERKVMIPTSMNVKKKFTRFLKHYTIKTIDMNEESQTNDRNQ